MVRISRNRIVSYIMTIAIILTSIFPNVAFAQTNDKEIFSDINGHWAEDTIIKHANKGMLKGYPDGTFKPDQGMKRCELISVINRYFGLKNKSNDNYNDINEKAWYADDTAKAKYYSYVQGLNVEPNKQATRDDVIGMLSVILDMEEQLITNKSITYSDIENLEEENRNNINEFSKMGYVQGYPDGEFKPNKVINRAEILAITEAVLGYIVTSEEDLKNIPSDAKKITIINPDITIENIETEADIYISAGVNGKLTIKDSKLKGKVEIAGGTKKDPIQFENVEVSKLIITKAKENPTINMVSTNVTEVKVKSEATINTDKKSVIKKADIRSKSNWTGQGKIQKAYVKSKDVIIEKRPQYVEVTDKKISVKIGKKDITYKTDDKRSYSGWSDSSIQQPTKTNINKVDITGQTKQGEILTANISPTGATATYKWQREELAGTYVDIAGATASTYTLTAGDVDKNIRVVATGTGSYIGEIISQPVGVILTNDPIAIKIKDGWIPVANKEELQQINSDIAQTFGSGTKYEDTYTGGMDKKYMLVADIDLTGENFEPIGYHKERPTAFTGKLTGEGYTISNLTIERDEEYQGFFSKLGQGAEITHVNIDTVKMKTSSYSGVLAGESNGARIVDIHIKHVTYDLFPGVVVTDKYDFNTNKKSAIGGYVGNSISTVFENLVLEDFNMEPHSSNNRNSLAEGVGGLAGMVDGGTVKGCTVKDITLRAEYLPDVDQAYSFMLAGGLIGQLNNSTTNLLEIVDNKVENIDMKISGLGIRENSGGLIGEINNLEKSKIPINGDIRISDCQVTGVIQGGDRMFGTTCAGGLIGTVDGKGTPLGKIEISNSSASVRMYDFLKEPAYLDMLQAYGGIGGFAGRLENVKVDNCYATGDMGKFGTLNPETFEGDKIDEFAVMAGFAGWIEDSIVEDCYATGDISCGGIYAGGFVSLATNSFIDRCYATGNINTKTGDWIGSFIGGNFSKVTIKNSYAIGNINGGYSMSGNFGGFFSNQVNLENVYGAGQVTVKTGDKSAFIGYGNCELSITNSFYNITGNETLVPIGDKEIIALKSKTTDELKQIATFTGWDISEVGSGQNTVWLIEEGVTYPYLNDNYISAISTECAVTSWNTPSNPTIGNKVGTDIRKTVDNETSEITIDVNVSNKATWKLYSDSGCTTEIGNKKLTLSEGTNTAYLKVTAEDGSTNKVYTLTITRESAKLEITKVDITGQTKQGEILTANISPAGATATYKWQREELAGTYVDIAGATKSTYTLTADDVDKNIRVVVTGTGSYIGEIISQPVGVILTNDPIAIKIKDGWIPVANKEELQQINNDIAQTFGSGTKYEDTYTGGMDKKYMLVADIDLIGENFEPIGYHKERPTAFTGKLTGEGYTISNLTIERDEEYQGFFSKLGQGAEITHVNIDTVKMKTSSKSGVLAGESDGARITDSEIRHVDYNLFPVMFLGEWKSAIGGYVGVSISTVFENLTVEDFKLVLDEDFVEVWAENIGGLSGIVDGGTVKGCTIKDITMRAEYDAAKNDYSFRLIGGLIGQLNNSTTKLLEIDDNKVKNIDMKINGMAVREASGGLIGEINNTKESKISTNGDIRINYCQVTGSIQGGDRLFGTTCAGGLIGIVDGTETPLGKIEISNSNTSVRMYDFLKDPGYVDTAISTGGVGGFAGRLKNVKVDNCYATGHVGKFGDFDPATGRGEKIDEYAIMAGFAGWIEDSYIEDSFATGDVHGTTQSGGFACFTSKCNINRCYAMGDLYSKTDGMWIGSLIGMTTSENYIQDSYATGNINNGDRECGNFIGLESGTTKLHNVYGAGKVTVNNGDKSGFIGSCINEPSIINSFYNITGNETLIAIGNKENTALKAKTADELKQIATFTGWNISEVGSGQNTVWLIEEGVTYPYLNDNYISAISTECAVTSWNTPSNHTIGNKVGTDIRKTVDNKVSEITIDVNVSKDATWKLYSDSGCTTEIGNKKLTLSEGTNTAYLKVTAEDGSTNKVYILTITREHTVTVTSIIVTGYSSATTISDNDGTLQMIAEILPKDVDNKEVAWSVSDESIATISETGLLTAVDNGTVVVIAIAKDGSGVEGKLEITISGQSKL